MNVMAPGRLKFPGRSSLKHSHPLQCTPDLSYIKGKFPCHNQRQFRHHFALHPHTKKTVFVEFATSIPASQKSKTTTKIVLIANIIEIIRSLPAWPFESINNTFTRVFFFLNYIKLVISIFREYTNQMFKTRLSFATATFPLNSFFACLFRFVFSRYG